MKKFICIPIFLFVAIHLSADDSDSFRKKEIKFISELYKGGRYFDCIAETEKLQMNEKKPVVEFFIYLNYYLAGQYSTVINNYTADYSSTEMQYNSLFLLSGSYLKKGMYSESYEILKGLKYGELPGKYNFSMFLRRVEPLILSGEMEKINEEIAASGIFLEDTYNFIKLREELQLYSKDGSKSPTYAAVMSSIVPGLGQCYAGYPGEGIISLLSVAATVAGGLYMKDNGRKSFAYTLFFFSGLFYGGNIYGAYNSAEAGNLEIRRNRYRNITSQYGSYNPDDYIDIERVFN